MKLSACGVISLVSIILVPAVVVAVSQCGENEEFQASVSRCDATCYNSGEPFSCNNIGRPGCVCHPGFVRQTEGGRCVTRQVCAQECGPNEEYRSCLSNCPRYCNATGPVLLCHQACVRAGCACKAGFLPHSTGCVPESQCVN
ncbi:SCO-spondin-like [Amblyomma americanum]